MQTREDLDEILARSLAFLSAHTPECILQTLQLVECDYPTLSVCKVTRINADISKLMWSRSN